MSAQDLLLVFKVRSRVSSSGVKIVTEVAGVDAGAEAGAAFAVVVGALGLGAGGVVTAGLDACLNGWSGK